MIGQYMDWTTVIKWSFGMLFFLFCFLSHVCASSYVCMCNCNRMCVILPLVILCNMFYTQITSSIPKTNLKTPLDKTPMSYIFFSMMLFVWQKDSFSNHSFKKFTYEYLILRSCFVYEFSIHYHLSNVGRKFVYSSPLSRFHW